MTTYRVEVAPAAIKALRTVHPRDRPRIQGAIALLAHDPRPPAATPLRGRDAMRVRVGDYRIVYQVKDDVLLVLVVALGHRREVYR